MTLMRRKLGRAGWTARVALAAFLGMSWSATAEAGPRDDMREAYATALDLFNNLDYEGAAAAIESGIEEAQAQGAGNDPSLASLYLLRAALLYSNEGEAARARIIEALKRAVNLNYHVVIPVEVRSSEMSAFLQEARAATGKAAPDPITHSYPEPACGGDLVFEALLGVPDGGQAALYWRRKGESDYRAVSMETFSNVATAVVRSSEHQDGDVEYIIAAFDSNNQNVANLGTQESPLELAQKCNEPDPAVTDPPLGDGDGDGGDGDGKDDPPKRESSLPKYWVNLGLGTGFGIARGTVDVSYAQYRPRSQDFLYGAEQHACAIARWAGGPGGPLPSDDALIDDGDPNTPIDTSTVNPASLWGTYAPAGRQAEVASAWSGAARDACGKHHPVTTGLASAPFHIAPEFSFRLGNRVVLGVFARLQVVTGSNVVLPDPDKDLGDPNTQAAGTQYWDDVYSPDPQGKKVKLPFTWAIGAKFKYVLGKENKPFRPYVGGFAGYGQSRLRVNLGFGQDANGNSVPDDEDVAADATDGAGTNCFQVWPYNGACNTNATPNPMSTDNQLAGTVASNAKGSRVDTVSIGPGFVGALVGFNYQIVKHFGLYGEFQVGGWFPATGSALFDLTVGPAITF